MSSGRGGSSGYGDDYRRTSSRGSRNARRDEQGQYSIYEDDYQRSSNRSGGRSSRFSRYEYDDDDRSSYEGRLHGGRRREPIQEPDEFEQFARRGRSGEYDDDFGSAGNSERNVNRGQFGERGRRRGYSPDERDDYAIRGSGWSPRRHDEDDYGDADRARDDRGSNSSYEDRSRGGRHSAQMQERDEFGQFEGDRRRRSSRRRDEHEDGEDRGDSSRGGGSSSRFGHFDDDDYGRGSRRTSSGSRKR